MNMTINERVRLEKYNREHALKEHWKKRYECSRNFMAVLAMALFAGGFVLAVFDVQVPNLFELLR